MPLTVVVLRTPDSVVGRVITTHVTTALLTNRIIAVALTVSDACQSCASLAWMTPLLTTWGSLHVLRLLLCLRAVA
jgi:hypothetical protein